ncbi:MAG: ABC transporter substrate-binding protein [Collinsella sp.]|nr:ABC transporter substrate-binding protein [Collinsella sp.]
MKRIGLIKKGAVLAVTAAAALALTACGAGGSGSGSTAAGGSYKIGVLQLTEHPALDAANKGFVKAIEDSGLDVKIDQQNAQNDQSACQTIASKFVGDGDDLIFAIATPAAQAAAGATTDIPIVGTAITDFAASGLVADNKAPGNNVTGTSDLTPVAEQIQMLHKVLPDVKTVGLLYASNESNSEIQIKIAEDTLDELGIAHERFSVSSTNEIQSVVESAVGKVDAIYSPTDNTIAQGAAQVGQICKENKIPFIPGEEGMCMAGGLFTLSIDYERLGYNAGEMAVKILRGEADPAKTPIEYFPDDELTVIKNEEFATALGIDLSVLDE